MTAEPSSAPARRGPAPKATRDEVLAAATATFAAQRTIDVLAMAKELGVGRATIYRWFGSREGLITEVLVRDAEQLVAAARRRTQGRGAAALLQTFDTTNRMLAGSPALRHFAQEERPLAARLITLSSGAVQQRIVELMRELIEERIGEDGFAPLVDPETLAYAVVRLAEAFLFNDANTPAADLDRLRDLEAALLGLPAR